MQILEIDGSYLEGGGQIIRTAAGLSALTGKPCRIFNIRKGRPKPGLKAQHFAGLQAVARLCNAETKGIAPGSTEIVFHPGEMGHGALKIDVGTAGSVTLVLQSLLIAAAKHGGSFEITGGTHVEWSPTTGYFRHVFSEFMKMVGIEVKSETERYGYYPKGGGNIRVDVKAGKIMPLNLTERLGKSFVEAWSNASQGLKDKKVAERQIEGANVLGIDKTNVKYVGSLSPGSSITVSAAYGNCFLGASSIGRIGKRAEDVGREAALDLKKQMESGACLDRHMADQILPFLALAEGSSEIRVAEITSHCKTNIWVIEKFLPVKFAIRGDIIACRPLD